MKKLMISCALGLAIAAYSLVSAAQCTVDTDCKGNRICQAGQCVDATPAPVAYTAPPVAASTSSSGPSAAPAGGFHPFVVGAFMSMGMALVVGDLKLGYDQKPRFAGGGGAYFDFYVMEMFAVEAGIGFVGKGFRLKESEGGYDYKLWERLINMEIPLGVKLNIHGFQASVALALDIAVSGKTKTKIDNNEDTHTWGDDDWKQCRRFNLGPRVALGYAIPLGPVALVPGLSWSMDVINWAKNESADDYHIKARGMNLMFNVGAEFGFGG
jgi:hypothetical protein